LKESHLLVKHDRHKRESPIPVPETPVSFSSACTTMRFRRVYERFELLGIFHA
jgi:hypothetical protein